MSDSKRWLKEHQSDFYVKKSQKEGYPSRAAYKLLEIQEKDKIIKPGMIVVDLGAAPGGWSMVARELVGSKGQVIALDILPMQPISGVTFIQGDFNDETVLQKLNIILNNQPVDLVISDMAPNISGQKSIDQPRAIHLVEIAWDFARQVLTKGGTFLVKVFQGQGSDQFLADLRKEFREVKIRKPNSSRPRSREVYVLGRDFLGYNDKDAF